MIPRVIHYCWFGKGELPPLIKKCITSWKKYCPDYKIIEWNESNFDININPWTKEAYENKKYAFVSDYARLFILYNYGGIYLDTDIELTKNIDEFLSHEAFSGFENEKYVQSGIIGSLPKNSVIKRFLEYYNDRHFVKEDGSIEDIPNVRIITEILKDYGLKLNNEFQVINGIYIYPRTYFCPIDANGNRDFSKNTYCIHHFTSTWRSYKEQKQVTFMHRWYYPLYKKNLVVFMLLGKLLLGKQNAKRLHTKYKKLFLRD
ncbi:glycosyl transferase [Neobacillus cucumis]|uniref:glycosyltransferase family 32 protein n=1 Tax=Neobacillus cucumis TaxID=1740721 RepID=UPI00203A6BB3|nr:glycosyltransferase [Neobacillus cucumis]MCM3724912.1 glycosyl transferase [Neobacillus cucumis]